MSQTFQHILFENLLFTCLCCLTRPTFKNSNFSIFPTQIQKYMSEALVDLSKRISKLIPKQIQDIFLNIKNTSVTIFYTITHGYQ